MPWLVHELLPSLNGGHALNQVAHQSATHMYLMMIISHWRNMKKMAIIMTMGEDQRAEKILFHFDDLL